MNNIQELITKYEMCTSCGLCQSYLGEENVKLEQVRGFYFPNFNKKLSEEQISDFSHICPSINMKSKLKNGNKFDSIVGNHFSYYNGYSTDKRVRWESSTGGGITSFASFLLTEKYIDGVLHIGQGETIFKAEPHLSRKVKEIKKNCGSQYMPTTLLINLLEVLNGEETIAIIGKPCDIRAVDNLLDLKPKLKKKIFLKIAFLCGGIPSIKATHQIIEKLGADSKDVKTLKYRGNGWPGNFSLTTFDNRTYELDYEEAWGKNLGRTVPLVCKLCFDSVGDSADIVFGDAWKSDENGYPIFDESSGNNLIITRNNKADRLLHLAKDSNYIYCEPKDINQFSKIQPSQTIRRSTSNIRVKALRISKIRNIKFDKFFLQKISQNEFSLKKKFRFYLGTIRRIRTVKRLTD